MAEPDIADRTERDRARLRRELVRGDTAGGDSMLDGGVKGRDAT
jgi:hypothetical protein